jgi:hypothetical protein
MSSIRIQDNTNPWQAGVNRLAGLPDADVLNTNGLQNKGNDRASWATPKASWATPKPIASPGQVPQGEIAPRLPTKGAAGFFWGSQLNDRKTGDFPRVGFNPTMPADWRNNPWLVNEVGIQNRESNAKLLGRLNTELQVAAHGNPIADALMKHYVGNSGKPFVSPPGSAWSNLIRHDGEGKRVADGLAARIHDEAEKQYRLTGRIDMGTLKIPMRPETDLAVWGNKPWSPAFGAFGSTDGTQVEIRNAKFDPVTKQVTGTMRITLIDTFGVSNSDNDSPGQIAMWLLQHQRGQKPFIHEVQFDVPLSFKVRTSPPQGGGHRPIP